MNTVATVARQVRYTNRAFWRNPANAFFTFAFPLMFLVIFTSLLGGGTTCVGTLVGDRCLGFEISTATYYIAAIGTFSIITATYTNLAINMTFLRDLGVLKRARGTPMPASAYMGGRVVHAILVAILLIVIVMAFGVVFYDASVFARTLPALIVTIVVGAACFSALGLALTAIIPNADASPAIVNASILPLLFLSGIFIPIQDEHAWYVTVAKVFPVRHFFEAMQRAVVSPAGHGWSGPDLLIMAGWGLVGLMLAARFFSWEPRK